MSEEQSVDSKIHNLLKDLAGQIDSTVSSILDLDPENPHTDEINKMMDRIDEIANGSYGTN